MPRHRLLVLSVLLVLLLASLLVAISAVPEPVRAVEPPRGITTPWLTRKIVLVGVDGLRLQESWDFQVNPAPAHPAENHTPRITAEILPQATLFRNARNGAYSTTTTPCTNTIVTGMWHAGPNRGRGLEIDDDDFVDNRTLVPTILEHARKDAGLARSKVFGVTNKLNSKLADHSYHPAYGAAWGPTWIELEPVFNTVENRGEETFLDPDYNADLWVYQHALQAMETTEPDFMFLYFGLVDLAGHHAERGDNFLFYTKTIENFDRRVADLWKAIQSHPSYAGKTTMLVVSDHGRHADHDPLAYTSHRGTCEGCRSLLLFAIGPDTPQGLAVDRRVWQTDVAPTIAALLGVDMPYADGQPLFEALVPAPPARRILSHTDAVLDGDAIVAASRECDGPTSRIVLRRTEGGGQDFGDPMPVTVAGPDSLLDHAALHREGDVLHLAYWQWTEGNHKYVYARSEDGGRTFPVKVDPLFRGLEEDHPTVQLTLGPPRLLTAGGEKRLFAPVVGYDIYGSVLLQLDYGPPGFDASPQRILEDRVPEIRREGHHQSLSVQEGPDGHLYAVYSALRLPSDMNLYPLRSTWEVFFKDLSVSESGADQAVRLTDNNASPEIQPVLAMDLDPAGTFSVVFAGLAPDGTTQLFLTESTDPDRHEWTSPTPITASPVGAWEPSAVRDGNTLHVVYVDFAAGNGDVRYVTVQGGWVSPSQTIAGGPGVARRPRILAGPDGPFHVVWEDCRGWRCVVLGQATIPREPTMR